MIKDPLKLRINLDPAAEEFLSGVGNYTVRLAEALNQASDCQIDGFYFNFNKRRSTPKLTNFKIKSINFPLKIYAKLDSFGLRFPCDLGLHPVDATIFPNFANWKTHNSRLTCTTVHDLTFLYFPETMDPKNLAHLQRVVPRALNQSDLILTVSNTVKQEIIQEFKISANKIIAMPIPASATFANFNPKIDRQPLPKIITTPKIITFVGNFEPRKNLKTLVEAYLQLPPAIQAEYGLAIAGSAGWGSQDVQDLIDQAKQDGKAIFQLGNLSQPEVASLISQSSVFVMPSLYEGFGMPVIEAMMLETPVVAADIPILHETAAENALFFDPKSAGDLAAKIEQLLGQTDLRQKLVRAGKTYAASLSWQDNAQKLLAAIKAQLTTD